MVTQIKNLMKMYMYIALLFFVRVPFDYIRLKTSE